MLGFLASVTIRVGNSSLWNAVSTEWWFDETYLGIDVQSVVEYYTLLYEYSALPHA